MSKVNKSYLPGLLDDLEYQLGFHVLPRRWALERTFAWLSHNRRLSKDYGRLCATSKAWVYLTMIRLMLRHLAHFCRRFQTGSDTIYCTYRDSVTIVNGKEASTILWHRAAHGRYLFGTAPGEQAKDILKRERGMLWSRWSGSSA